MGYTEEEISTAAEKLVATTIRRAYDPLGSRRYDLTFSDMQQAAASVFLFKRNAPFYVAWLGAQRRLKSIVTQLELLSELKAAVEVCNRRVFPVKDLTHLANAKAALLDMEVAVGKRSNNFRDFEKLPAYVRFKSQVEGFLGKYGNNIKSKGAIVATPQEARNKLSSLLLEVIEEHQALLLEVESLRNSITNYNSTDLPTVVASSVLQRARQTLDTHLTVLEGQSEEERLATLRTVVLDLLTSKRVVAQYGALLAPSKYHTLSGDAVAYSDSTHLANPAKVTFEQSGPWSVLPPTNTFDLYIDTPPVALFVGTVEVQQFINGLQLLPYKGKLIRTSGSFLTDGVAPGAVVYLRTGSNAGTRWLVTQVSALELQAISSSLVVGEAAVQAEVYSKPTETVTTLTSYPAVLEGTQREPFLFTAAQTDALYLTVDNTTQLIVFPAGTYSADQVVTYLNANLGALSSKLVAEAVLSPVSIDTVFDVTLSPPDAIFTAQAGTLSLAGFSGLDAVVLSGPNAGTTLTGVSVFPTYFQVTAGPIVDATGVRVQVGTHGKKVRLRFQDQAAALEQGLTISTESGTTAAVTLGWPTIGTLPSLTTTLSSMVESFNGSARKTLASLSQLPLSTTTTARSIAAEPATVVLYKYRTETASITAVANTIHITLPEGDEPALEVGDEVVLRSGANPNSVWVITQLSPLVAQGLSPTQSTDPIELEIGEPLYPPAGSTLTITSGPNTGTYTTLSPLLPFDIPLQRPLPKYKDVFAAPVFFSASLTESRLSLSSANTTLNSRVAALGFFQDFHPIHLLQGTATTPYLLAPLSQVAAGDVLEYYSSNPIAPDATYDILQVDTLTLNGKTQQVWTLDQALPYNQVFHLNSTLPSASVRSTSSNTFSVLEAALKEWQSSWANQFDSFVKKLNAALNPLLVEKNPTVEQVGTAKNTLDVWVGAMQELQDVLGAYSAEGVDEVDVLLKSYREKGADRAVDLLLSGRYSDFFGLSWEGVSYTGAVQEKMREVARNDVPVRKENRSERSNSRLVAQVEQTDPEYNESEGEYSSTRTPEDKDDRRM